MFLNNKIIYERINEGNSRVIINKFCTRSKINICDYSLYEKITATASDGRLCVLCFVHYCSYWYEIIKKVTIDKNIINLSAPSKCLCERCYNLFPYIKFLELKEKIMLLRELKNFINNDIIKYTMYFLIMS